MKSNFKISIVFLFSVMLLSCISNNPKGKDDYQLNEKITITTYKEQLEKIEILKKSMTEYMDFSDPSYTEKDIEKCESILTNFIQNIDKTSNREEGLKVVQSVVFQLNELNKKCDFDLIETNEREQITEIIIEAGYLKGYNLLTEDVTEEWREW